jgi:hypothetical protein
VPTHLISLFSEEDPLLPTSFMPKSALRVPATGAQLTRDMLETTLRPPALPCAVERAKAHTAEPGANRDSSVPGRRNDRPGTHSLARWERRPAFPVGAFPSPRPVPLPGTGLGCIFLLPARGPITRINTRCLPRGDRVDFFPRVPSEGSGAFLQEDDVPAPRSFSLTNKALCLVWQKAHATAALAAAAVAGALLVFSPAPLPPTSSSGR